MKFRVEIPGAVHSQIDECIASLTDRGAPPSRVEAWLLRLIDRIESLDEMPRRYPVSEAMTGVLGYPVYRMIHEDHAVFYTIDDQRKVVRLIAFRDGRRRPWEDE